MSPCWPTPSTNSAGIQSVGMTPEMSLARNMLIHRALSLQLWDVKLPLGCVVSEVLNRLVSHNFCKAKSLASEPSDQLKRLGEFLHFLMFHVQMLPVG